MTIQIKDCLTKTRNPIELDFKLENRTGELIQVVGDGYCLIKVEGLYLKKLVKEKKKKMLKLVKLEWYVHEQDFYISTKQRTD